MRTSVVTGCAGGIGRAISAELAAAGDRVIGMDRAEHGPSEHLDRYISCDLGDAEALARALDLLAAEPVDCLVNCAGLYIRKAVFDLTPEDFDRTLAVNLRAPFLLSQRLARGMAQRGGGVIVNIGSIAGKLGSPIVPYGASKAGLHGLTKSMARTLAPYGIRVNAVAPGTTRTAMAADVDPAQMEAQMAGVPMGRWAEPEEMARVVRFLTEPGSSYMTGAIVEVTGGWPA